MASTPSTILRFEKQGSQDNTGAWDVNANRVFDVVEEAIAGFYDVPTTGGDTTLTSTNYASDQARRAYIRIANGQTITSLVRVYSATLREYLVHNASAAGAFDVKFGYDASNLVTIPRGCACKILVRSGGTVIQTSPLVDVATGQVNAASLTTLYGYIPIETQNTSIGVLSSTLATPPVSPTTGDRYIVATSGTGAWSTKDGYIAEYNGSSWDFTAPSAGMIAWDRANHWLTGYDAGGWQRGAVTDPIPTGGVTYMMFWQGSAPTGWTKQTTHSDKGIRVVSGAGGLAGGSRAFSTVFGLTSTDTLTLANTHMPGTISNTLAIASTLALAGTNGLTNVERNGTKVAVQGGSNQPNVVTATEQTNLSLTGSATLTGSIGGGGNGHAHDIDLRLAYLDMILCSRN